MSTFDPPPLWRRLTLCRLRMCGGGVVTGFKGNAICVGWRCATCGAVKGYEPTMWLFPRRPAP